eukprot:1303047-Rhodomonas_salina.2
MLADFFAHMGRPVESAEMYRKMLSQPEVLPGPAQHSGPHTSTDLLEHDRTCSTPPSPCAFALPVSASPWRGSSASAGTNARSPKATRNRVEQTPVDGASREWRGGGFGLCVAQ